MKSGYLCKSASRVESFFQLLLRLIPYLLRCSIIQISRPDSQQQEYSRQADYRNCFKRNRPACTSLPDFCFGMCQSSIGSLKEYVALCLYLLPVFCGYQVLHPADGMFHFFGQRIEVLLLFLQVMPLTEHRLHLYNQA